MVSALTAEGWTSAPACFKFLERKPSLYTFDPSTDQKSLLKYAMAPKNVFSSESLILAQDVLSDRSTWT